MAIIGLFSSINDKRMVITPSIVSTLCKHKHTVLFHNNFSLHSGYSNEDFENAGAIKKENLSDILTSANVLITPSLFSHTQADLVLASTVIFSFSYLYTDPELAKILAEKRCTVVAMEEYVINDEPLFFPALRQLTSLIAFSMLHKLSIEVGELLIESDTVAFIGYNPVTVSISEKLHSMGVNSVFFSDEQSQSIKIRPLNEISAFLPSIKALILLPSDKFTLSKKVFSIDQLSIMPAGSVVIDLASFYGGAIEGVFPQTTTQLISGKQVLCDPLLYSPLAEMWIKTTANISENIVLNYLANPNSVNDICLHIDSGKLRNDILMPEDDDKIEIDIEEINFEISNILTNL